MFIFGMATASMMLILGFYGSVDLVLCSSVSRFVQVNSLFVRDIKFSICSKLLKKYLLPLLLRENTYYFLMQM